MHITLRHKSARGRSTTMVGVLLAIILPASLIMGGLATADTTNSESSVPEPTRLEQTAADQPADPSANAPTLPASPAGPQSPLPSPSPLNTASPLTSAQAAPKKPGDTGIQSKSADSQPQTRAAYTVAFSDPDGKTRTPSQSVPSGGQASRPDKDPSRDGYLFDGWFIKDANGDPKVAYDFTQPVTGNITLTAKWTRITSSWSLKPTSGPAEGGTRITLSTPTTSDIRFNHLSAGTSFSLAMGSDGNLYSWGSSTDKRPGLVTPPTGVRLTQFGAGLGFFLAMGSDGNLYSWGSNYMGQLGNGTTTYSNVLSKVNLPTGVPKFTQFSTGWNYSLALGSDDNLYSWGENLTAQLGNGTNDSDPHTTPSKVIMPADGTKFTQFKAGDSHSLALGTDGNLYSWGYNYNGQLGRDTSLDIWDGTPRKVIMPTDGTKFTQISTGYRHSLALGTDGNVYSWGDNSKSQLGRSISGANDITPRKVNLPAGVRRFTQVIAGGNHSLAMGSDGNLYSWGDNTSGQLGRNSSAAKDGTPGKVAMPAGITITQASAPGMVYGDSSLALGSDGNLYSWGDNTKGQLGRDTSSNFDGQPGLVAFPESPTPTGVSFGGAAGTSLVGNKDGTWSVTTPQHAAGKTDVTVSWNRNGQQPDAHLSYTYINPHTVTFDSAGGQPTPGQQQITEGRQAARPTADPARDGFLFDGWFLKDAKGGSKVAYDFSQPVTADITLVAHWSPEKDSGWSISPGKGNVLGGQRATITPPRLSRGIRFSQVSAGGYQMSDAAGFSVGVASDGNAYAWGSNQHGQLGIGNTTKQNKPVKIPLPDGVDSGFTYTQAAAGGFHVLAVGSDGIVYSWGANDHGQLGDGTTVERSKPQPVPDPNDTSQPFKAVQVSAGAYDSAAISPVGHVYTWGSEGNSRDGNFNPSFTPPRKTPTPAAAPDGSGQGLQAVRVSLGWSFIMALDEDGNVYAWGYNNYGQLGNNSTSSAYTATPARVRDPNSPNDPGKGLQATQISAGTDHGLAIDRNGTVLSWGHNNSGQLGNGSTYDQPAPEPIKNPGGRGSFTAVGISTGVIYSLAVDSSGNTWAWGYNAYGQLGNGDVFALLTPTRVRSPDPSAGASASLQATRVSAAQYHSLAIGQDGNAYAWGDNRLGQLGNGSLTQSRTPTLVAFNPALLITGVKFDKTVVDPLVQNPDGSVTLATPAHNPGLADVVVDWTLGGTKQEPAHLAYTYEGVLPLTGGNGSTVLLLAAGLLAVAGAAAAGRHRREARALHV